MLVVCSGVELSCLGAVANRRGKFFLNDSIAARTAPLHRTHARQTGHSTRDLRGNEIDECPGTSRHITSESMNRMDGHAGELNIRKHDT